MAKGFRFRLEVVETLRRRARDSRRRVVAEHVQVVVEIEQRIARLAEALAESTETCRAAQGACGSLDVGGMHKHLLRRRWLQQSIAGAEVAKDGAQSELSIAQASLAEASRHLRVIEKLHERRWARYQAEIARREQAQSDEGAVQRYLRRRPDRSAEMLA